MGIFKLKLVGDISIFNKKRAKLLKEQISAEEEVLFCLKGTGDAEALIALSSRILIMKFHAFGEYNSASFLYRDIINIQTEKSFMCSKLTIHTPEADNIKNTTLVGMLSPTPSALAYNRFSFPNTGLQIYLPYIEKIRTLVQESKKHSEDSSQKRDDSEATKVNIADQIETLSNLRQSGALTEEEYAQAKKKILET